MISSLHRFHGHSSLQYLYRMGRVARGNGIALKYVPNQKRGSYRAAVVVSRKVHKSAVVRNRIRRRIYERIRLAVSPAAQFDMAFMVYDQGFATMSSAELDEVVVRLLQSAAIIQTAARVRDTMDKTR